MPHPESHLRCWRFYQGEELGKERDGVGGDGYGVVERKMGLRRVQWEQMKRMPEQAWEFSARWYGFCGQWCGCRGPRRHGRRGAWGGGHRQWCEGKRGGSWWPMGIQRMMRRGAASASGPADHCGRQWPWVACKGRWQQVMIFYYIKIMILLTTNREIMIYFFNFYASSKN